MVLVTCATDIFPNHPDTRYRRRPLRHVWDNVITYNRCSRPAKTTGRGGWWLAESANHSRVITAFARAQIFGSNAHQHHRHSRHCYTTYSTLSALHTGLVGCINRSAHHAVFNETGHGHGHARYVCRRSSLLISSDIATARPAQVLLPVRGAQAAFFSNTTSTKRAAPVTQSPGLVSGSPSPPAPMKTISGKNHVEVPLPSQEGKKGAVQYAL